jgi:hypothetical protein
MLHANAALSLKKRRSSPSASLRRDGRSPRRPHRRDPVDVGNEGVGHSDPHRARSAGRGGLELAWRYERSRPGELIHIDVKKLGGIERGAGKRITGGSSHYNRTFTDREGKRRNTVGWEFVHRRPQPQDPCSSASTS